MDLSDDDIRKEELYGRIAHERGLITREQMQAAWDRWEAVSQASKKRMRLGEVMMEQGVLTREQALLVLKETHLRLGDKPRIGGYELERLLGKGAMGMVYRARQLSMDRPVALKLLSRELSANEDFVRRFMREARTTAKLNHNNIIAAIDIGESNGYHYFAMEYVDGRTLEKVLKREGPLAEKRVLEIAVQIVQGLEHAAQHGIIHRDIKPANIMMTREGVPKIADMGLAILTTKESSDQMTGTGIAVGTPYYMAPEQVEGKANIDFRADIYALGATVFEMLTGKKPFDGANVPAIMAKRLYEDPPVAANEKPGVSREISAVVYKMMARSPDSRYQDFPTLLEDLGRLASGRPPTCMRVLPVAKPAAPRSGTRGGRQKRTRTKAGKTSNRRVLLVYGLVGGGAALVLAVAGFVLTHSAALGGAVHPFPKQQEAELWKPFAPVPAQGEEARRLWEQACALHLQYEKSGSGTQELVMKLRLAYQEVINRYPMSAYAAEARERMALIKP